MANTPRSRRALLVALCGVLAITGLFARLGAPGFLRKAPVAVAAASERPSGPLRFAVLGDSDSQSYHDTLMLGGADMRGGPWRATTWQWTEVLARLRGDQVDLGEWGAWGTGKYRAFMDEALGRLARTPPKDDYRYDFAVSGATCRQLMSLTQRQAVRLVELMDTEPLAWRGGVVLIRIGINDIGGHDVMDELSLNPHAARPTALIDACVASIGQAVALIHKRHPATNIVLVGILSNADWSVEFGSWQNGVAISNIDAGLDRFDNGLRKIASTDRRMVFLDDRAWFRSWWGERDDEGRPNYKTVRLAPGWAITNTSGNDPHNAVLTDSHAGVVWNALWTQHLVASLNTAFGLSIKPITDEEVIAFLQPAFTPRHPYASADVAPQK